MPRANKATLPADRPAPPLVASRRRSQKQSELIARDLASYIVDSDLPPGTPLPPEREMVQSLGVGRTTLREALRLLETRGVLTIRSGPRGGPIVRRPNPRDLSSGLSLILQFEQADLTVVMEARCALEPAAARMAATRITSETLERLRATNRAIRENANDVETFFELNREFHRLIAEASGNIVVRMFVESIMSIAELQGPRIAREQTKVDAMIDKRSDAHERLIDVLAAGDADAAEAAMTEHLEDSYRFWGREYKHMLNQPVMWKQGLMSDGDGAISSLETTPALGASRRRSPKQSELIARDLATYIVDSDLPPGTALPAEREMVESLGVGRTTLREALRLLETRGVLTIRSGPRGGPVVRRPDPRDLSEGLSLMLEFEKADLAVMMEARSALEPAAARMAATRITPEVLDELEQNTQLILDSVLDTEAFFELNKDFHRLVAEASGNIVVRIFVESIMSLADGKAAGIVYRKPQIEAIVKAHDRVIEALRTGDPKAAESAMNDHLEDSHRYWRRKYGHLLGQPVNWTQS